MTQYALQRLVWKEFVKRKELVLTSVFLLPQIYKKSPDSHGILNFPARLMIARKLFFRPHVSPRETIFLAQIVPTTNPFGWTYRGKNVTKPRACFVTSTQNFLTTIKIRVHNVTSQRLVLLLKTLKRTSNS